MVILIADDDRLARFALKSMLCDLAEEELMIYEASNGKRLVEQCKLHQPDVAFVDIDMPQLDGLSAISQCKAYASDAQFVVVSGHSDFSYARRSIELQVADYLVKPIDAEQLAPVLKRVKERLHLSRMNVNLNFNVLAGECFRLWEEIGYCPQEDPCAALPGKYYAFRFYLDAMPVSDGYRSAFLALTEQLQAIGKQLSLNRVPFMLWEPKDAGLDFIVRCDDKTLETLRRRLEKLCAMLANAKLVVSCMYVSGMELWSLFKAMKETADCEEYRYGTPNGVICEVGQIHMTPREQELLRQVSKLVEAYQEANESNYNKALSAIRNLPEDTVQNIQPQKMVHMLGVCMNTRFSWNGSLSALYRQLEQHKENIYTGGVSVEKDKFSEIVKYVDKHYMEELSVTQLAEKMNLTPNYFSKIFHDRMGKTFSQYLTEVRIAQARRILLVRKDVRVKDVALMVGYFSSRHFTNVFKKMTGCYPSDFRKQNLGDG